MKKNLLAAACFAVSALPFLTACPQSSSSGEAPVPSGTAPITSASVMASASASASASAGVDLIDQLSSGPVTRESHDVTVDGVKETWRLEWKKPPVPTCMTDAVSTCACTGFAFGEKGDLDLVRAKPGAPEERLDLGQFFEDHDARLVRWPATKSDAEKKPSMVDITMRPVATVMKFGDYDHDGRETELVLQVGANACGHTPAIVVGISKTNPKLHAFTTAEKPTGEPVSFDHPADWEKLRTAKTVDTTEVACGDHGSDTEVKDHVTADGQLHVTETKKKCP